jgi:hypothetical protein
MKRSSLSALLLMLAVCLFIASCGSSRNASGRKCDGRKGQKTPMGLI